jgi:putative transposase
MESGLWEETMHLLVQKTRLNANRNDTPSYCLIDSQSVKTTSASDDRGFDSGKKSKAANDIS